MNITEIPEDVKFPDVEVTLSGADGNAFVLLGLCKKAIQQEHGSDAAKRWLDRAQESESYDDLLRFMMSTLDVS